jgi:ketosteroid isomerase-like protein
LLKADQNPIVGAAAKQFYQNQPDIAGLTWRPNAAFIARPGELGYTYDIWTLASKDTTLQGTYVTIWRKQHDGSWKFVLDTGQNGLGKK